MNNAFFIKKKLNPEKLLSYGFCEQDKTYLYSVNIMDDQFQLTVIITKDGTVETKLLEISNNEEYILHRAAAATGAFVGAVKAEYEHILGDIAEKCFEPDVFQSEYAKKVIEYVRETYQDELEFLWPRTPNNAVFRRKDTGKWYSALLTLSKRKLGIASDETIEILDLRVKMDDIAWLVDGKKYFSGYHMNKNHWITICLDGSVSLDEITKRIDDSYALAVK